jgi:dihydrofolate synthase/folylpolyglutamate synthase
MYQRIGKAAYKADLNGTVELLNALGNPQKSINAIHIAGTNGKGSVSHIIASVLQSAGYKVGLYTSPHLKDFRERVRINGKMIPEDYVTDFVSKNMKLFSEIRSSFFEMTVGLAFDYFNGQEVDYAVMETGMGGRLDSTNLCNPIICAITNISFDHTTFLGNTLTKIAIEKAGIIKRKVPVVIGRHQQETDKVFLTKAADLESPIYFSEDLVDLKKLHFDGSLYNHYDVWSGPELLISGLQSPLIGDYQTENLKSAITVLFLMMDQKMSNITTSDITNGVLNVLTNTELKGRWQTISNNPLTITDTAHNEDGLKTVIKQLRSMKYNKLHMVFGMVNDKNINEILSIMPNSATYYFCRPDIPRGMDENTLAAEGFKAGLTGKTYSTVTQALNAARNNCKADDIIFVGGSTFVVAEVI